MAGLRQDRAAGTSLPGRLLGSWVMVPALFIAGGLGGFALQSFPEVSQALLDAASGYGSSQVSTTREFSICAGQLPVPGHAHVNAAAFEFLQHLAQVLLLGFLALHLVDPQ